MNFFSFLEFFWQKHLKRNHAWRQLFSVTQKISTHSWDEIRKKIFKFRLWFFALFSIFKLQYNEMQELIILYRKNFHPTNYNNYFFKKSNNSQSFLNKSFVHIHLMISEIIWSLFIYFLKPKSMTFLDISRFSYWCV